MHQVTQYEDFSHRIAKKKPEQKLLLVCISCIQVHVVYINRASQSAVRIDPGKRRNGIKLGCI